MCKFQFFKTESVSDLKHSVQVFLTVLNCTKKNSQNGSFYMKHISAALKRCKQQLTLRGGDMQTALCAWHLPMEWKLPRPCKVPNRSLLSNVGFSVGGADAPCETTQCVGWGERGGMTLKSEMSICRGPEAECWPDT